MTAVIQWFVNDFAGKRIPLDDAVRHPMRYLLPNAFLVAAILLLIGSLQQPYWHVKLRAPQYPQGLTVTSYVDHLQGDVTEIDGLNHYIGMRKLGEAAQFEKSIAVPAVWAMAVLVLLATVIHSRWSVLFLLPAILFPLLFLVDLHFWLANFGRHLDPHAPLSSAIKPFTPPVLGIGKIGQFRTIASAGQGLVYAAIASGLLLIGIWFHRAAYKPLAGKK
jgi:hypothetical protein